jgi:hypothetical protein
VALSGKAGPVDLFDRGQIGVPRGMMWTAAGLLEEGTAKRAST